MAIQLSPGVSVKEYDFSQVISPISSVTGAVAGSFSSGPFNTPVLISNESQLVEIFGKPLDDRPTTFFSAKNFLDYSNRCYVTRAINPRSNNTIFTANSSATIATFQVLNDDDWENNLFLSNNAAYTDVDFVAKYPNKISNNYDVYVNSNKDYFSWRTNTADPTILGSLGANKFLNVVGEKYVGGSTNKIFLSFNNDISTIPGISVTANTITCNQNYVLRLTDNEGSASAYYNIPLNGLSYYTNTTTLPNGMIGGNDTTGTPYNYKTNVLVVPNDSTNPTYKVSPGTNTAIKLNATIEWKYASEFLNGKPTTSTYVKGNGGLYDEMNIIIVNRNKAFGTVGHVLEKYQNVSKASDAKNEDGTSNYFVEVLRRNSDYIYPVNYQKSLNWYNVSSNTIFISTNNTLSSAIANTGSQWPINLDAIITAYGKYADKESITVDLLIAGNGDDLPSVSDRKEVQNYVLQLATDRMDAVAFVSYPDISGVLPSKSVTTSNILENVTEYASNSDPDNNPGLNVLNSYGFMDSGYKYQFDKYYNKYRWIPLNADIAGLVAETEIKRDSWWSPAGHSRGHIKNAVKLSWNPTKAQRDQLYINNVNPVVSLTNEGILLYGDKTLQQKASAFDRINVRRLFITLERTIAKAAKYSLFEFNDVFTRSQFVSLVEPYLREIKSKRGIYDYKVVCDETNNTPLVIDQNRFVGSIFIKPARSINFIELNFVAVATGVDFTTITDNAGV